MNEQTTVCIDALIEKGVLDNYVKMVAINWFYLKRILAKFLHNVVTNIKKKL